MSAGGVVYFVLGLLAISFFYIAYGVIVEETIGGNGGLNDQFENPNLHVSQERMDSAGNITLYWKWLPAIALIVMFIFAVVIALREHDGNISEGW